MNRSILFILSKAPYEIDSMQEEVETMLFFSAFASRASLLLCQDGLLHLKQSSLNRASSTYLPSTYKMLSSLFSEVDGIYMYAPSSFIASNSLDIDDSIQSINQSEMLKLIQQHFYTLYF